MTSPGSSLQHAKEAHHSSSSAPPAPAICASVMTHSLPEAASPCRRTRPVGPALNLNGPERITSHSMQYRSPSPPLLPFSSGTGYYG